ncbi:non-hydrolyzing UDP-N-acetylglucosamine 2-epimerase [Pseudarthrobacter cellobiosi]|uniref:non-hydrolyzing UDP-N-acetylglucosamine 2-epimerase n=1 Tax=Pseudarthrobacter cellobiosi TaxID=2953654 RepID=UPI00208E4756|nr:UDP-N-acetylglucosamine 2-epimerase (non-hydrolyzing) [Pseudarthrobacter sp. HLT1-5]MCO4254750.1 UDP-N-acetylglucosamine 2-epimerase (non-hydrolyzing) [Pseudarthrobacter sp. HLT1-5]
MTFKLKVATVVGTRPEIIRLAATIKRLDKYTDHVLIHTGQNYDYELNEIFFEDLGLRKPDHFLQADVSSLGAVLGSILTNVEAVLLEEKPDAMVVLGDTNSCISAVMARRMKIPVFHMEAGNRCFDENVPEEVNRRLVDHVSDYNLVYTEHARRNLLAEGIHPARILLTGSPMKEVLKANATAIDASDILERQGLQTGQYVLVSLHREENVDSPERLRTVLEALNAVGAHYGVPVLLSTHPRTRKRLEGQPEELKAGVVLHPPFGFNDYVKLQKEALIVLSDSGTISEESSLLGFAAVTLRDFIERPESLDTASIVTSGLHKESILDAIELTLGQISDDGYVAPPTDYQIDDASRRVVTFIRSAAHAHHLRAGLRRRIGDNGS